VGFADTRARLAALRGDQQEADAQLALAVAAMSQLDSLMVTAAVALTESFVALFRGDWTRAAKRGSDAAEEQNFADVGSHQAAQAAIAAGLADELALAIERLRIKAPLGRIDAAMLAFAEAGQLARAGRLDDGRAGFRAALTKFREGGDLLNEALTGLIWGLLANGLDPEAAAAEKAAEAFFTERGAAPMLPVFRAAFVPVAEAMPRAEAAAGAPVAEERAVPSA